MRVVVVGATGNIGTSLAGQCTNEAVVIDFTKRCHRLLSADVRNKRCGHEGVHLAELLARGCLRGDANPDHTDRTVHHEGSST